MTAGSVMTATMRIGAAHRGQARGSTSKLPSAHQPSAVRGQTCEARSGPGVRLAYQP